MLLDRIKSNEGKKQYNRLKIYNKLKSLTIPEDYIFMSLDVTALFTNISLSLVE